MKTVNLLLGYPVANDLAVLAHRVSQVMNNIEFEERESSNYVDGRYFSGHADRIRVIVALSDEPDHGDLPYWIALSSTELSEHDIVAFADVTAKEKLIPNGFRVARFVSFGRLDEQRIDY